MTALAKLKMIRSSHRRCRPAALVKKRLWHRCFPVNFENFLRTPFLKNTSVRLLLNDVTIKFQLSKGLTSTQVLAHQMCNLRTGDTASYPRYFSSVSSEFFSKGCHFWKFRREYCWSFCLFLVCICLYLDLGFQIWSLYDNLKLCLKSNNQKFHHSGNLLRSTKNKVDICFF